MPNLQDKMNEIAAEAKAKDHDLGKGWNITLVFGIEFYRLECINCHDVAYLWSDGSGILPMTFDKCPGKIIAPDLSKMEDDLE